MGTHPPDNSRPGAASEPRIHFSLFYFVFAFIIARGCGGRESRAVALPTALPRRPGVRGQRLRLCLRPGGAWLPQQPVRLLFKSVLMAVE